MESFLFGTQKVAAGLFFCRAGNYLCYFCKGKLDNLLISNGYSLEKFVKTNIICVCSAWFVKENKDLKTMF